MSAGPSDCPCSSNESHFHLYQEIESLKKLLNQRDAHIVTLETALIAEDKSPASSSSSSDSASRPDNGQSVSNASSVTGHSLQLVDKYDRLSESHKRLQRVNQALEDKLLRVVDRSESERTGLRNEVSSLSIRLSDALDRITVLEKERNQYKNDCLIAVQLLNNGRIDHVLQSLRDSVSNVTAAVPAKRAAMSERRTTFITTTFPPTSILVEQSPVFTRKTSEAEDMSVDEESENGNNRMQPPSEFLVRELNQRVKNTEYSINFHDQNDSINL